MQEANQLRRIAINLDDIVGKFDRMAGGKTNAIDTINAGNQTQQIGKGTHAAIKGFAAIRINVLTQQIHLANALRRQLSDLKQDVIAGTADFFTAGIRHHAERTIFITAFHDGHKGGWAIGTRFRQTVKFFNFREADIHYRTF